MHISVKIDLKGLNPTYNNEQQALIIDAPGLDVSLITSEAIEELNMALGPLHAEALVNELYTMTQHQLVGMALARRVSS